jgi:hypothetical protein
MPTISGKADWRNRQLGKMIRGVGKGDVIVVSEDSRLTRSTLQVLEIGRECIERGVHLHVAKNADKIDGYLDKGINKVAIAKLLDVSPNTLYEWLKVRRPISTPAP